MQPTLYKYLDESGARAFLDRPQLRFRDFRELDDLLEILPGFRPMTDDEARFYGARSFANAPSVSLEKHIFFLKTASEMSPFYLEAQFRDILKEQPPTLFVCSMTTRPDSTAMWAQYAARHSGIAFGVRAALSRIAESRRDMLVPVEYSEHRLQTTFPTPDFEIVRQAVRRKGTDWSFQSEWRMISESPQPEFLEYTDIEEIVVGYRASDTIRERALAIRNSGVRIQFAYPSPERFTMRIEEERP